MTPDSSLIDMKVITRYLLMLGEIRLIEEGPIAGDICIFDVGNATASMVSKLINPVIKKGIMCSQVSFFRRLFKSTELTFLFITSFLRHHFIDIWIRFHKFLLSLILYVSCVTEMISLLHQKQFSLSNIIYV